MLSREAASDGKFNKCLTTEPLNKRLVYLGATPAPLPRALFISGPGPALKNNLFFSGAREPAWDVQPSHGCYLRDCRCRVASLTLQSLSPGKHSLHDLAAAATAPPGQ